MLLPSSALDGTKRLREVESLAQGHRHGDNKWQCGDSNLGCVGLPWWLSGKESACHCRKHRFEPWSRKIPHATEPPSPCTTAIELQSLHQNYWSTVLWQEKLSQWEACTLHLEKACAARMTQHKPKVISKIILKKSLRLCVFYSCAPHHDCIASSCNCALI